MADLHLTQLEADELIRLPKTRTSEEEYVYPGGGGALVVPLQSEDQREDFLLDVSRGRINLAKGKYQTRARQAIVLVRLDFGGAPHRNPDGEELACPHLHRYREGFGDKWATPVPEEEFSNLDDLWLTLEEFMAYCNVVERPHISGRLLA